MADADEEEEGRRDKIKINNPNTEGGNKGQVHALWFWYSLNDFRKSELDEIIRLMIRQGDLDPMAASANIDVDDPNFWNLGPKGYVYGTENDARRIADSSVSSVS